MNNQKLILIAEDEPDLAHLLHVQLRRRGYCTALAADGHSALQTVFEQLPDLVILDLMLPELHGLAVCQVMKYSPRTRHIPVLVLTALNSEENRSASLRAGAGDFLSKPYESRDLITRLEALLPVTPPHQFIDDRQLETCSQP